MMLDYGNNSGKAKCSKREILEYKDNVGTLQNKDARTSNEVNVREEDIAVQLVNTNLHVPCLQGIP